MLDENLHTQNLHADRRTDIEHGSLHKPIHSSVAFGYKKAEDLANVFQNKAQGFAYARQGNPTTAALENKITLMEGGLKSLCFSTGMAAIGSMCLSLLKQGDHIISSSYLFGNTNSMFTTLERLGLEVSFVDVTDVSNVEKALRPNTKLVFTETIANPVTQIADLKNIGDFCEAHQLIYAVDSTMTSPYLFLPKTVKATFAIHSLTKYIGGHGNALGGSLTDLGTYPWDKFENILDVYKGTHPSLWAATQIRKKGLRDFGASLNPDDAHRLSTGSETMSLRLEQSSQNALSLAQFLEKHPKIAKVNYPGLPSHPQHARAKSLFKQYGALMSFELQEGFDCMYLLNQLKIAINSSNLGDNRTLAIPVAHTIFYEMGPERRRSMGIADSLIRLSVGIETTADLIADFEQALAKL